ncbi:50S ribosomal protein L5 [Candidatus Woesebacteria bacterium RIFCSPHIGHO2_01_FULL_39_32]|uniref:Large ribosomal subunit protein uL5 n=2 Tax=Candidatus Woeseibacteriota TaxID=1752722 RepID=A0A0G0PYY4_9BACT|nr:MAG: 50S ribosomal protein L5 [Candidatus Woesebacteria bacterium GW2011_GWA1_39_8]OGM04930.1 MAG: 50S ribosomal protein L5 [Candidatus Woesebacteria bacterium GWB1_37_5]OGM24725.1 MAG: 50S ribosomal protein L5 [Candidatus Woesebacteria bacterium RIFCSPHIGHO2_01_FULL_39_32]OGM38181.1 MAG: 50S ribosomal protein L5 [Candidatus Woesebacteria bacterium RIFCSPHIGHO2_12_FULL_38_11]OGM64551.1 MAG: 50S ribosomal protein L5 [Candidatus Woesebacteria bacterium RIFCSPLOWO2_01_FULL_39_25]
MGRLKQKYEKEIRKSLAAEFRIDNSLAIPKITKVVVNMGVGEASKNKEVLESTKKDLAAITGQMASVRNAKVSVASFGIRRGMPVGLKVTLRGERMYSFLDKLFSINLPRLRDFRGLSVKSFDKYGNYTLGLIEHSVFPEIDLAKVQPRGLEITIVTNTNNVDMSKRLLELLGMPFEKKEK